MDIQKKRDVIADYYSDESDSILFLDEEFFDDALLGVIEIDDKHIAVYSETKCIECLMTHNNWSLGEAVEYFDYNVVGAYVGEYTPKFINDGMFCYD